MELFVHSTVNRENWRKITIEVYGGATYTRRGLKQVFLLPIHPQGFGRGVKIPEKPQNFNQSALVVDHPAKIEKKFKII